MCDSGFTVYSSLYGSRFGLCDCATSAYLDDGFLGFRSRPILSLFDAGGLSSSGKNSSSTGSMDGSGERSNGFSPLCHSDLAFIDFGKIGEFCRCDLDFSGDLNFGLGALDFSFEEKKERDSMARDKLRVVRASGVSSFC